MATKPQFSSVPIMGAAAVSATADTTYLTPAHTVTVLWATGARTITGSVVTGSTTLTSTALHSGDVGRPVSGATAKIPAGTIIISVVTATSAIMSAPATGTETNKAVTLGGGVGMKVEEVDVIGNSASVTVAGMVNVFVKDAATHYRFVRSFKITAVTPSTTVPALGAGTTTPASHWRPTNLWLQPNDQLVASSWVASQHISVNAWAGAY